MKTISGISSTRWTGVKHRSKPRYRRSVFLLAAEFQHACRSKRADKLLFSEFGYGSTYLTDWGWKFSCHNLRYARLRKQIDRRSDELPDDLDFNEYRQYYSKWFMPPNMDVRSPWWGSSKRDNEARILALLLMAEILRR